MVSLLLIISFLIHILTLIVLFNVMKRCSQLKTNNTNEIDQLLSTYLEDIKSENDRLQRELIRHNSKVDSEPLMTNYNHEKQASEQHKKVINMSQEAPDIAIDNIVQNNEQSDMLETSIEARALQLHNKGHSITEIAQKLNRGKTEISLIIDLNNRSN